MGTRLLAQCITFVRIKAAINGYLKHMWRKRILYAFLFMTKYLRIKYERLEVRLTLFSLKNYFVKLESSNF